MKRFLRLIFDRKPLRGLLEGIAVLVFRLNPGVERAVAGQVAWGRAALMTVVTDQDLRATLTSIPSETTVSERMFLYNFFATVWAGNNNVLEIGPFVGGTTRAIALGMQHNPRRSTNSRLYTFDRFRAYYDDQQLASLVTTLDPDVRTRLGAGWIPQGGDFKPIFDTLHRDETYYPLIIASDSALPDHASETQSRLDLPPDCRFDAVFVDGCKSWYATRYLLGRVGREATAPGTFLMFQDYAWYTCFWIPAILQLVSSNLRLVAHVDSTYVFQVATPFDRGQLTRSVPEDPFELDRGAIEKIFQRLGSDARVRRDSHAEAIHEIQYAAALAYCNYPDAARLQLDQCAKKYPRYRTVVRQARHSPTYRQTASGFEPIYL